MAIPRPGHPVPIQEEQGVIDDCRRLHNLIDSHDVVFLLTDTRESRWLPSLMCANSNKVYDQNILMIWRICFFPSTEVVLLLIHFTTYLHHLCFADIYNRSSRV